jgi:hypothetical protein
MGSGVERVCVSNGDRAVGSGYHGNTFRDGRSIHGAQNVLPLTGNGFCTWVRLCQYPVTKDFG